jgi:hypothetical protein
MTLIVTFLSNNKIVQASDRRLTLNGKLYDDHANKAVTVTCDDAYFSVAYTGLAEVQQKDTRRRMRTDQWIAHTLCELMQQGYCDIYSLFYAFANQVEETYRRLPVPLTYQGTKFVLAGYFFRTRASVFSANVSNMIPSERGNYKVQREFRTSVQSFRPNVPDHESDMFIDGSIQALTSKDALAKSVLRQTRRIHEAIKRTEREATARSEEWIAQQLVQIIRMASHHPVHGKYVNRDCMTVNMTPNGPSFGAYYYSGDRDEFRKYLPYMVTENMIVKGWAAIRPVDPDETKQDENDPDQ